MAVIAQPPARGARHRQFQQFGHGLDVPERVVRVGMAKPGRQLDHLACRILACAIPVDHGPNREGVTKVMYAWSFPVQLEPRVFPQPDCSTDPCEAGPRRPFAEPVTVASDEELPGRATEQPVTFGRVGGQPVHDSRIEWQQALLSQLAMPDTQHSGCCIKVVGIQRQRFADPESRDSDQAEEGRTCQPTHPVGGRQFTGRCDDAPDLGFAVDVWPFARCAVGQQPARRRCMRRVDTAQPKSEQPHHSEPGRPGG